jgi:hypothetical protein
MALPRIPPKKFAQWLDAEIDAADAYMARLRNPCEETIAADHAALGRLFSFLKYDDGGFEWEPWQREEYTRLMRRLCADVHLLKVKLGLDKAHPAACIAALADGPSEE